MSSSSLVMVIHKACKSPHVLPLSSEFYSSKREFSKANNSIISTCILLINVSYLEWKTENDYEIPSRIINSLIWCIKLCSKYTTLEYVVKIAGFYIHTQVQELSICPGHELMNHGTTSAACALIACWR